MTTRADTKKAAPGATDAAVVPTPRRSTNLGSIAQETIPHPHWCDPELCVVTPDRTAVTHRSGFREIYQRRGYDGSDVTVTPLVQIEASQHVTTWDEIASPVKLEVAALADGLTLDELSEYRAQVFELECDFKVRLAPTFQTPCPDFCQHDKIPAPRLSRLHNYVVTGGGPLPYPQGTRARVHWGVVGKCVMAQHEFVLPDGTVEFRKRQIARRATAEDLAAVAA